MTYLAILRSDKCCVCRPQLALPSVGSESLIGTVNAHNSAMDPNPRDIFTHSGLLNSFLGPIYHRVA